MNFNHLFGQTCAQIATCPFNDTEHAGDIVSNLRTGAKMIIIDGGEVVLEIDTGAYRTHCQ